MRIESISGSSTLGLAAAAAASSRIASDVDHDDYVRRAATNHDRGPRMVPPERRLPRGPLSSILFFVIVVVVVVVVAVSVVAISV